MKLSKDTQQRRVHRCEFNEAQASSSVETLSVDGGKVRKRTPKGEPRQWKDYKAITLHGLACAAAFQKNESLVAWVKGQPLASVVTCLGDGHDGVWNLVKELMPSPQRREILDWYHLIENLHKVGGSQKRLERVRTHLWHGQRESTQLQFQQWSNKPVENFLAYVHKHKSRLPDYCQYQQQGICIGSGAVESTIKRIGQRIKLSGAQWKLENVNQVLRQRCAYLNLDFA